MTDQPTSNDPYAKPPSGASAAPPPVSDPQPGSWNSPGSLPPGAYGEASPSPPAYGHPPAGSGPLSPEASSVRSQGIIWTVINGVSMLFGNLLGIIGLAFGLLGLTRASTDVAGARRNVRLSWISFIITIVLWVIGNIIFWTVAATGFDFDNYNY